MSANQAKDIDEAIEQLDKRLAERRAEQRRKGDRRQETNIPPARSYALRKNGMYYAHKSCGYVSRILLAELFTEDYATRYARDHEDVTAVSITEALTGVEEIQEYIDRLAIMKKVMQGHQLSTHTESK